MNHEDGTPMIERTTHAPSDGLDVYASPDHPVDDPGLGEHVERYTDVDEAAGNRAYRQVVGMFALVPLLAVINLVIYFAVPRTAFLRGLNINAQHLGLGLTGGLMVLLIGVGCIHWAKQLMSDQERVEYRHPVRSSDSDRQAIVAQIDQGIAESGLSRRRMIGSGLAAAVGLSVLPALVLLGDLGPAPTKARRAVTLEKTIWAEGVRLVNDVTYEPIKAAAMEIGQLVNAQPENLKDLHGSQFQQAKAKSSIIIVRMDPNSIKIPDSRKSWQVNGILCYSKICTHVGCPISLWEQQTHHLLCPCHQSTFDLGDSGVVVFGPAARALPQLPITMDASGYLVARSDFTVPVGPSYFERDSRSDFTEGDR